MRYRFPRMLTLLTATVILAYGTVARAQQESLPELPTQRPETLQPLDPSTVPQDPLPNDSGAVPPAPSPPVPPEPSPPVPPEPSPPVPPEPSPPVPPEPSPESSSMLSPPVPQEISAPAAIPVPVSDVGEWHGSVMFSIEEITKLNGMLQATIDRRNNPQPEESDYLQEITGQQQAQQQEANVAPIVFPTFYLSTVMYVSDNEWIVWVNGHRIDQKNPIYALTGDQAGSNLRVESIEGTLVRFVWKCKPEDIASARAAWSKAEQQQVMQEVVTDNGAVSIKPESGEASFALRPNQTMLLSALKVIEGRMQWKRTVTHYISKRKPKAADPATPDAAAASSDQSQAETPAPLSPQAGQGVASERESMDAMINQYQNFTNALKK